MFIMGDNGIVNVLLSVRKDVGDVVNERIHDVKQEVVQRAKKEEGVCCW